MPIEPTIVAELTPAGTGAIAVVALHGPRAWEIVRGLFTPASGKALPAEMPAAGEVRFGKFGDRETVDEVVLVFRPPWIELQGHGGRVAVEWMLELLQQQGATACRWPEFLRQTAPRWRALAAEQLAQARTVRAAAILLDQYHGAFETALEDIRSLVHQGNIAAGTRSIEEVLRWEPIGRHLVVPWRVAVAGPPNVGKSSLVNALAGFQRSIVAPVPGTTRDVVTVSVAFDGWAVELIDTAGMHDAANGLEQSGITLARETLASADLCVWLFDAGDAKPVWPEPAVTSTQPLWVINKCDLPAAWDVALMPDAVCVSARTGAGLGNLIQRIVGRLTPAFPPAGAAVPFHLACWEYLHQLRALLAAGAIPEALDSMERASMPVIRRNGPYK